MKFVWTHFKRWALEWLRSFRLAMPVLLALAVGLALVTIWWLGPHWRWREYIPLQTLSTRVLASVLVFVCPLLLWSLSLRRRYRRLQADREQDLAVRDDPCLSHVQAQERDLNLKWAAFMHLARDRQRGRDPLPWYLVMGNAQAGKTRLLAGSAQPVVLSQAIGQTKEQPDQALLYPIEWWLSDDALLIDAPSQFASVAGNAAHDRLWFHWLGWLGRQRSQRALNGVVLVIDLVDLLNSPEKQTRAVGQHWRRRLNEMTTQLGIRLPVYVVLSKLDLLEGFDELLGELSASEREAVTGFSFRPNVLPHHDAWLDELEGQLTAFIDVLAQYTLDAKGRARSRGARQRLISLYCTLGGMRPLIAAMFEKMLGSDRFTTPALVRGVFFSSVVQSGPTYDAMMAEAEQSYGIPLPVASAKPRGAEQVYFSKHLFSQAVYPESGLAGDNLQVARAKRQLLLGSSAVAALGVLVATGGWQHHFAINRDQATTVLSRGQPFDTTAIDTRLDATGRNLLEPLAQIRDVLALYGDYRHAWPGVSELGLYQGRKVGPLVDEAYLRLLSQRFLPALAHGVIDRMDAAAAGSQEQLEALRVYRMIEDRENRQPQWVEEWMAREWQMAYPGQGLLQAQLLGHLRYALEYADAQMPQYHEHIAEVQHTLRQIPLAQRVYMALKQRAGGQLQRDLVLRREVGPAFDKVYAAPNPADQSLAVPALLTAKGYRGYFEPRSEDLARLAIVDQWVLGERSTLQYSPEDLGVLANRLSTLYTADYIDHWRRVLNQLDVVDFKDLAHGVGVLQYITGPAAPVRRLLETVADNSHLMAALPPGLEPAAAAQKVPAEALAIRREFAALARLLEEKGEQPAYYDEVITGINVLYDYSKSVQDSAERGKAALAAVMARFALTANDPISDVQRMAASLPEPLNRHVKKLADQTGQVLMVEALRELERRWDADVYRFYQQRLASRYPFTANGHDASLQDFEAFFGPKGRLQAFQDQYLNLFLRDNLDALKNANRDGYLVRTDVLQQLGEAERIRETFFNNQGALGVQFSLEPMGLSGNKRSSVLALDGQLITYSHGPSHRVGLIWPNTLSAGPGSKLAMVHPGGNSSSLGFQGPWSLFRLLSSGQLQGHTDTSVELSFRIGDGLMRYRVTAEKALNPFTQRPFQGFSLPRTLLVQAAL